MFGIEMKDYRNFEAYKISKRLSALIYFYTLTWPREQIFGLTSQVQRAAVSVLSNLAEGCGRVASKDTCHFLAISRGSCYEVEAQIDLACELGYLTPEQYHELQYLVDQIKRLLNGLYKRYENLGAKTVK